MNILSRLRLRTKLALLMGLSALALAASIAMAASVMRQRMIDDRVDKLHAVIDTTVGLAQSLENQVIAHQLSREQAMEQFRNAVRTIRFDAGAGYVVAQTLDNLIAMHGANPKLDNTPSTAKDADGRSLTDILAQVLRNADQGFVSYAFAKPGETLPQPKVAYVARFAPWGLVFVAGAYTDDLDATFRARLEALIGIGGVILLVTLLAAWLINRDITGSLGRLKTAMGRLSGGDLDAAIPGAERRDEIGAMAGTVLVFKDAMQRAENLATQQQDERARADAAKRDALVTMAELIEAEAKAAMAQVGGRTAAMADNANSMSSSASRTGASAEGAASAAAQALANAQTVASAAEQLAASIREIGAQVDRSTQIVARAVEAGRGTRETMGALNEQVGRIGSVADMISEIAAKTNLLALNATIEAARAGDAGKGFAVVASEVKQLATQTARSTEEISRHIAEVRAATGASVAAVGRIEATIGEVNAIAGSIAAAVEEQGAATAEIARNVAETADAANAMTERTREVSAEAGRTGLQAAEVLENTTALNIAIRGLERTVINVVRSSTAEVDRRRFRRRPCLVEATIACEGRPQSASLRDISERGCFAVTELRCQVGGRIDIALSRFDLRLQGTVAEQTTDGFHISFTGEGLPAAEADRISLTTVAELVRLTKDDHLAYVKRVVDAVTAAKALPLDNLPDQHACRLGRWYDAVTDSATKALPSFKAIAEPHHAVHRAGRQVLVALATGEVAAAQRAVAELRQHSERVMRCLEEFGRAYPATITQQRVRAEAAIAA